MPGLYTGAPGLTLVTRLLVAQSNGGAGLMAESQPVLGPELVTDPNFDNAAVWTAQTGWTVSGGLATKTAGTGSFVALTGVLVTAGKTYYVVTKMTRTAGTALINIGGKDGVGRTASGTYAEYITATSTGTPSPSGITIYGNSAFAGAYDSFSVREVYYR